MLHLNIHGLSDKLFHFLHAAKFGFISLDPANSHSITSDIVYMTSPAPAETFLHACAQKFGLKVMPYCVAVGEVVLQNSFG